MWFHTTFLAPYIWSVHTVYNLLVCSARFVVRILLACVVSWRCLWHNKCTRVTYGKPWVCNASAALSVSLCHFSFHLESLYVVIEDCQNPMSIGMTSWPVMVMQRYRKQRSTVCLCYSFLVNLRAHNLCVSALVY